MALFHKSKVNFQQEIDSAQNKDKRIKGSSKLVQEGKKVCSGFGVEEIKDCGTKNMAT